MSTDGARTLIVRGNATTDAFTACPNTRPTGPLLAGAVGCQAEVRSRDLKVSLVVFFFIKPHHVIV
jgi:hypothetical protein